MSATSLATDKLVGQVLADRYEILHRLGEGAMGVVYQARHVKVGRAFAVKVLHPRALQDPKVVTRFDREAECAGQLRHPNVVGVVDVGEVDGTRYMVMELAEGPDLAELLEEAPMPPARIIHLVRQLLDGLYHAHEHGLIHRDLKPENVIVERDGQGAELPRILDFGIAIAREAAGAVDREGRLTTNGLVLGTPHYMAPEQAVADPIDHRIDLFALGIMVYEMLSGRMPFDGSGAEIARANLLLDPPPIGHRVPHLEVDPLLEAFARRLMAKKRDARPRTALAARELLDLIDRDRPAAAAALGLPQSLSGRHPAVTEPVPPHDAVRASPSPSPDVTARMKPTPQPRAQGTAYQAADPSPDPRAMAWYARGMIAGPAAADRTSPSIGDEPPAVSASPALVVVPGEPPERSDRSGRSGARATDAAFRDTVIGAPLRWDPAPAPSRKRWLIGGGIVGVAGIAGILAVWIGGSDSNDDVRTPADRTVLSAIPAIPAAAGPAPSTAGATAPPPHRAATQADESPDLVGPAQAAASRALEPQSAVSDAGSKPRSAVAAPARPARTAAQRRPAMTRDPAEPSPVETSTGGSRNAARPAGAGSQDAGPGAAKASAAMTGLTANELSELWATAARTLRSLPQDRAQDLWARWRLLKIQPLMGAPQATRDVAAAALSQIYHEALRRQQR